MPQATLTDAQVRTIRNALQRLWNGTEEHVMEAVPADEAENHALSMREEIEEIGKHVGITEFEYTGDKDKGEPV